MWCLKVLLLYAFFKVGLMQPMSDYEINKAFKNNTRYKCEYGGSGVLIYSKDYRVNIRRTEDSKLEVRCLHYVTINFTHFPLLDMSDVSEIEVINCGFENENMFSELKQYMKLSKVSKLKIEIGKNATITSQLLRDYTDLTELELNARNKNLFEEDFLANFTSLTTLKLGASSIDRIPAKLFMNLASLSTLELNFDKLSSSMMDSFAIRLKKCLNLRKFSLNGISHPAELSLDFSYQLSSLKITDCNIESIDQTIFARAEDIEDLNLSNNKIRFMSDDFLHKQDHLKYLDLSHNAIKYISNETFWNNVELKTINLSNNIISSIQMNAFYNLVYLKELDLSYNYLSKIMLTTLINGTDNLRRLSLKSNKIAAIEEGLPNDNSLQEIDLSGNEFVIFRISQFWPKSQFQLKIILLDNKIQEVYFKSLPQEIIGNETSIEIFLGPELYHCNCFTLPLSLFLHGNLNFTPKILNDFIRFTPEKITCRNNLTRQVAPLNVSDMNPLLMKCPLDQPDGSQKLCPKSCECWTHILNNTATINCFNVSTIPAMPPPTALENLHIMRIQLNISGSRVSKLPTKNFDNFNSVSEIYASHTKIKYLDAKHIPDNLKVLDVRNCELKTLSSETLAKLGSLKAIFLSGNKWNCTDPTSKEIRNFVRINRNTVMDWNFVRCSDDRYFLEIVEDGVVDKYYHVLITVTVCFTIFFLILFLMFYRYNKSKVLEWVYRNDCFHVIERSKDFLKPIDACIVCAEFDVVFANYLGTKLTRAPNYVKKCTLIVKEWSADEKLPDKALKVFRNSRRVIVVLSEYLEEKQWNEKWSYSHIGSRVIFLTKGGGCASNIRLLNKVVIKFTDPFFWDKLMHAMNNYDEMVVKEIRDVEMQPLTSII